jgi:hypothetical protein
MHLSSASPRKGTHLQMRSLTEKRKPAVPENLKYLVLLALLAKILLASLPKRCCSSPTLVSTLMMLVSVLCSWMLALPSSPLVLFVVGGDNPGRARVMASLMLDQVGDGRSVIVYLDFAPTRQRQCIDDDFEKWYARTAKGKECLIVCY